MYDMLNKLTNKYLLSSAVMGEPRQITVQWFDLELVKEWIILPKFVSNIQGLSVISTTAVIRLIVLEIQEFIG